MRWFDVVLTDGGSLSLSFQVGGAFDTGEYSYEIGV